MDTTSEDISEKAADILRVYEEKDATLLSTNDITSGTGYSNDVVAYHIKQHLIRLGLLEQAGVDESASFPNPPNLYRITDRGQGVLEMLVEEDRLTESASEQVAGEDVAALWDELNDQEDTDDWLERRVDELEAQVEEQQAFIDKLKARMSNSS